MSNCRIGHAELSVELSELEVHSVPDDLEFVDSEFVVEVADLSLFADVCSDPLGLDCLFALVVDVRIAEFEACAYEVLAFEW